MTCDGHAICQGHGYARRLDRVGNVVPLVQQPECRYGGTPRIRSLACVPGREPGQGKPLTSRSIVMNLFAYGTLMEPDIMRRVALELPCSEPGTLRDHERRALRGRPYPGLRPRLGGSVDGIVYYDVSRSAWERLDHFEGEMYVRIGVAVLVRTGGTVSTWTYRIAAPYEGELEDADWSYADFARYGKSSFEREYRRFGEIGLGTKPAKCSGAMR
jgi:gamma-glutamylcyclotransferase (GGCT)/AIG2-like uncharacterized protein YtfP